MTRKGISGRRSNLSQFDKDPTVGFGRSRGSHRVRSPGGRSGDGPDRPGGDRRAPRRGLIGGADDVELIDVERVADDATATGTAVVGVLEIDEADEDDEEEAATPAVAKAKPAGKDATPDRAGESEVHLGRRGGVRGAQAGAQDAS